MFPVTANERLELTMTVERAVEVARRVVVLKTVVVTSMVSAVPAAKPIASMNEKKRSKICIFKVFEMKRGLIEVR